MRFTSAAAVSALALLLSSNAQAEDPPGTTASPPPGDTAGAVPVVDQSAAAPVEAEAAPTTAEPAPVYGTAAPAPAPAAVVEEEEIASNSIYAEGLGAGLFYSLNYERLFMNVLGVSLGASYTAFGATAGTTSSTAHYLTFPIQVNYLGIRGGSHVLEMGAGATLVYASGNATAGGLAASGEGLGALGTVHVGWRIHPIGGGFQFRIGVMALFGPGLSLSNPTPSEWGILPWGYLSLGASF